jgi:hypothetical protein
LFQTTRLQNPEKIQGARPRLRNLGQNGLYYIVIAFKKVKVEAKVRKPVWAEGHGQRFETQ